ncbi:MAG: ATP-binding protein, partial [Cyanobacteria bacterium J06635_15]
HEINIEIHVFECRVVIISTNLVNELREKLFQTYIQKIITSDVSELYFKQLEENIDNNQKSGLGLLTIINDYKAKVGWKFESSDHGYGTLSSVMVQLPAS